MKDFFPESLGQNCGCALYMAKYVPEIICINRFHNFFKGAICKECYVNSFTM